MITTALTEPGYLDLLLELPLEPQLQGVDIAPLWLPGSVWAAGAQANRRGAIYSAVSDNTTSDPWTDLSGWEFVQLTPLGATWAKRFDKIAIGGLTLQYEYARYDLLGLELGYIARRAVDWEQGGSSQKDSGWAKTVQNLQEDALAQIAIIEKRVRANRRAAVGQTASLTPLSQIPGTGDPNNPYLSGDPRFRLVPWLLNR